MEYSRELSDAAQRLAAAIKPKPPNGQTMTLISGEVVSVEEQHIAALVDLGESKVRALNKSGDRLQVGESVWLGYIKSLADAVILFRTGASYPGGGGMTATELLYEPIVGEPSYVPLRDSIANYDMLEFTYGVHATSLNQMFVTQVLVESINEAGQSIFLSGYAYNSYNSYVYSLTYMLAYVDNQRFDCALYSKQGWNEDGMIFSIKGIKH